MNPVRPCAFRAIIRNIRVLAVDQRINAPTSRATSVVQNTSTVTFESRRRSPRRSPSPRRSDICRVAAVVADNSADSSAPSPPAKVQVPQTDDPNAERRMLLAIATSPSTATHYTSCRRFRFQRSRVPSRQSNMPRPGQCARRRDRQPIGPAFASPAATMSTLVPVELANMMTLNSMKRATLGTALAAVRRGTGDDRAVPGLGPAGRGPGQRHHLVGRHRRLVRLGGTMTDLFSRTTVSPTSVRSPTRSTSSARRRAAPRSMPPPPGRILYSATVRVGQKSRLGRDCSTSPCPKPNPGDAAERTRAATGTVARRPTPRGGAAGPVVRRRGHPVVSRCAPRRPSSDAHVTIAEVSRSLTPISA